MNTGTGFGVLLLRKGEENGIYLVIEEWMSAIMLLFKKYLRN